MKIRIAGGGPAGLFFAYLTGRDDERHHIVVFDDVKRCGRVDHAEVRRRALELAAAFEQLHPGRFA